ncbi:MAG: Chemotaxis response regulator CheB [Caldanaerobacter subterraneus]|uniref:protein-glutamate methylesterase n=2 Tax=Caldanaerobacter subterraneus TaxID=911092 RepID=A0A101E7H7_9THEO|nr:CheB methylesterase domain-containing protein [Caldanaerobacter subterraneus]KKC29618.1 methylesterase CheB/methylase CheR [Caldanaerobacter subterraneus subsp. pacificus DSM 12653]KUK09857.1 MAG: Chemotaxis response regulator CheB [Caldanaerobacter subterraneus]MBE3579258.1 chemotaxis protein CheB [Caldanaerobacter subterraneus]HBT49400.1 chemotaxis protein CheB [Caldanaerobacter subterraneus]
MKNKCIVLIGSSTGGPRALEYLLSSLPENIGVPFIVVQHMPQKFTSLMAERLDIKCKIKVKEAEDGEVVRSDVAYITPGDKHLLLVKEGNEVKIKLLEQFDSIYKPSIDATFISASKLDSCIIAVILTGMGSDGSKGIRFLKEKKAFIISQDVESSIAKGMPYSAIKTGLVDKILPLDKIPQEIIEKVREFYGNQSIY